MLRKIEVQEEKENIRKEMCFLYLYVILYNFDEC